MQYQVDIETEIEVDSRDISNPTKTVSMLKKGSSAEQLRYFIQEPSEYYTARELAKKLNVPLKWVTNNTQARRIPGQIKIGRLWRYRRVDVDKALLSDKFLLEK